MITADERRTMLAVRLCDDRVLMIDAAERESTGSPARGGAAHGGL
jgi:hypothetical protein